MSDLEISALLISDYVSNVDELKSLFDVIEKLSKYPAVIRDSVSLQFCSESMRKTLEVLLHIVENWNSKMSDLVNGESSEGDISTYTKEIVDYRTETETFRKHFEEFKSIHTTWNDPAFRNIIAGISHHTSNLDNIQLQLHFLVDYRRPYIWKIENVSSLMRDNGYRYSQVVYLSRIGYRVQFEAGFNDENFYLSMKVLEGNYDDALIWPFKEELTVEVIQKEHFIPLNTMNVPTQQLNLNRCNDSSIKVNFQELCSMPRADFEEELEFSYRYDNAVLLKIQLNRSALLSDD